MLDQAATGQRSGSSNKNAIITALQSRGIYIALLIVLIVARFLSPAFYQSTNILNVLRQASALGILSVGQTIVMISGGIDLSVAATMQLATIAIAELSGARGVPVLPAILIVLILSALVGVANGLLVTRYQVPAFVATLFLGSVVTGARLVYTKATPSGVLPPAIRVLGHDSTWVIPNAALIFVVMALLADILLSRTSFGRKLYSVGGNARTSWLSGISVTRIRFASYILSAILAGIGGLVLAGYVGYADQWIGRGYELDSVAAVVIGGTSFAGGRGSIRGTVAGVLLVTVLLNLVLLLNLNVQWQLVIKGLVIIFAVALYSFRRRG